MQVTREDVTPCLVSFEISLEPDKFASAVLRARKDLGSRTEVPGFRKGKAPMAILERVLDPERVNRIAGDYLMPDAVEQVLKEQELDPWDSPEVEVLQSDPETGFKFKARVPLSPQVELGPYVNLNVERVVRPVTDDVINGELERLRQQNTRLEPRTEGVVEPEDYVFATVQELNENDEPKGEPASHAAIVGENVPDFDREIIGMAKDEEKVFSMTYPADWGDAECAGKTTKVKVQVLHVYKQIKPEMNDDFAKQVGEFETLDALKAEIVKSAERAFKEMADEQTDAEIIRQVVEASKVSYPPQMLAHEFGHRVEELFKDLERKKTTFEDYLKQSNSTEEQFRRALEMQIDRDLRGQLVLSEIVDREKLKVTDEEVEETVSALAAEEREGSEAVAEYAASDKGKAAIRRRKLVTKVLEFLRQATNIKDVTRTEGDASTGGGRDTAKKEA